MGHFSDDPLIFLDHFSLLLNKSCKRFPHVVQAAGQSGQFVFSFYGDRIIQASPFQNFNLIPKLKDIGHFSPDPIEDQNKEQAEAQQQFPCQRIIIVLISIASDHIDLSCAIRKIHGRMIVQLIIPGCDIFLPYLLIRVCRVKDQNVIFVDLDIQNVLLFHPLAQGFSVFQAQSLHIHIFLQLLGILFILSLHILRIFKIAVDQVAYRIVHSCKDCHRYNSRKD